MNQALQNLTMKYSDRADRIRKRALTQKRTLTVTEMKGINYYEDAATKVAALNQ